MTHDHVRVEFLVEDVPVEPADEWRLSSIEHAHGLALIRGEARRELVVIEGGPTEWVVILAGRRIGVVARGHRDRLLAATSRTAAARRGPADVRATLPGLVLHVIVEPGQLVAAGDPLVTIEAMKMQNEIRAPRAGRVASVAVSVGQTIATGALLVRLADPDP